MDFDWDQHNIEHIGLRNIAPEDVECALTSRPLRITRELRNGEERITYAGPDRNGVILVAITTPRAQRVRVVTAYPANEKIRAWYRSLRERTQ